MRHVGAMDQCDIVGAIQAEVDMRCSNLGLTSKDYHFGVYCVIFHIGDVQLVDPVALYAVLNNSIRVREKCEYTGLMKISAIIPLSDPDLFDSVVAVIFEISERLRSIRETKM